jgi:hypothetical protein
MEFYSAMTGKKAKKPLTPKEAAELCMLYNRSVAIRKIFPTAATYSEIFESAKNLFIHR